MMDYALINNLAYIGILVVASAAIIKAARQKNLSCVTCTGCVESQSQKARLLNNTVLLGIVFLGIAFIAGRLS